MKRKFLTIAISIFALIAIVSVGFASWVISRREDPQTKDGTISVETVSNNNLITMKVEIESDSVIRFSHPSDSEITDPWLKSEGTEIGEEHLRATITITLSDSLGDSEKINLATSVNDNSKNGYANLIKNDETDGKNYIDKIKLVKNGQDYTSGEVTTLSQGDFTGNVCKIDVVFRWGSKFGNKNPYNYYNEQTYSATLAQEAQAALKNLEDDLKEVTFTVTVTLPASN